MKSLALASLSFFSLPAFATFSDEIRTMPVESEIYSLKHSCQNAESIVRRRGAVIVHYGDGLYERVVAHTGFCQRGEGTVPFYAPTMDSGACFLGMRCAPSDHSGGSESH